MDMQQRVVVRGQVVKLSGSVFGVAQDVCRGIHSAPNVKAKRVCP
jgi:hypothetical protein